MTTKTSEMRYTLNQINKKQTFIKYLPCARPWTIYTKTTTSRHGPCPHGAHSLLQQQATTNRAGGAVKKGRVLPGGRRAGFRDETMELDLGREGVRQAGGGGAHSKQSKQRMSKQSLESTCHGQGDERAVQRS